MQGRQDASLILKQAGTNHEVPFTSTSTKPDPVNAASAQLVLDAVSRFYGVPLDDLLGNSRRHEIAQPRHVACYLLRQHVGMSYPRLGQLFDRNHTTILQAVRTVEANEELLAGADKVLADLAADATSRPASLIDERRRRRLIHQFGASAGTDDMTVAVRDIFVRLALELASICPDGDDFDNALVRLTESQMWATRAVTHPAIVEREQAG